MARGKKHKRRRVEKNMQNILPLDTKKTSLEILGDKGRSLVEMANAGLSVPSGFHVRTSVYNRFVDDHGLHESIQGTQ